MSEDAQKKKRDELAAEVKNLRRLKIDLEEDLEKKNKELTQRIFRDIRPTFKEFRKKKDHTLILEKVSVIASDDDIDVTEDVIKLYDKKFGK